MKTYTGEQILERSIKANEDLINEHNRLINQSRDTIASCEQRIQFLKSIKESTTENTDEH